MDITSKEALELLELILLNHSSMLVINDKRFEYFNIIKEHLEALEKENEELSQANSLLIKTLRIVIDCITNATDLNQLKIDIMDKVSKEVLGE